MDTAEAKAGVVVETAQGKVRGGVKNGVHFFKGLRYGGDTSGRNRFKAPTPPESWAGIHDALDFGPRAPQETEANAQVPWLAWVRDTAPNSEDCLRINIYTPAVNDGAKRPVLFYIHGGGFAFGSGSVAGLDGTRLSRHGDAVVVTVNHRLNIFGYLHLGDADGGRWLDASNAGMLDLIAALKWVRDNIAAFGGDPGCVTIFGQSGGGSKVSMLMAMPAAKGLFHRAIAQSPGTLLRGFDPDFAENMTSKLFAALGLERKNVAALQDLSMAQLLEGRRKAGLNNNSQRPVVDGRHLPVHPFDPVGPTLSKDIPFMIGSTDTEATFYLNTESKNFDLDEAQACRKMLEFLDSDEAGCLRLLAEFRKRRSGASPFELLVAIQSHHQFRRNCRAAAERKLALGGAPVYVYEFAWQSPVLIRTGQSLRSPHTICIPFVFGTLGAAAAMVGAEPDADRDALSECMMDAWIAFARGGDPNHQSLSVWKPYDTQTHPVMVFDKRCELVHDRGREDGLALAPYPLYVAERGARGAG